MNKIIIDNIIIFNFHTHLTYKMYDDSDDSILPSDKVLSQADTFERLCNEMGLPPATYHRVCVLGAVTYEWHRRDRGGHMLYTALSISEVGGKMEYWVLGHGYFHIFEKAIKYLEHEVFQLYAE